MADTKIAASLEEYRKRELGDVKVLLVEDDAFISEMVITRLSEQGCIPYSTSDGNEAVKLARQFQPNIVILDLMLPHMGGEEILAIMKADEELKAIPVIIFSNRSGEVDKQKLLSLGAEEYLVKAMTDLEQLTKVIKTILKK